VLSTLAYLLLYAALRAHTEAQAANLVALAVTAVGNTALNRRLTFGVRGTGGAVRQHAQGLLVFALGLAVTSGSLAGLAAVSGHPPRAVELGVLVVANLTATVLRFVMLRSWVFRRASDPTA
jgi:putative flippase GtrA